MGHQPDRFIAHKDSVCRAWLVSTGRFHDLGFFVFDAIKSAQMKHPADQHVSPMIHQ